MGVPNDREIAVGLAGRIVGGAAAGAVGTLAMDLLWWSRARRGGSDDGFVDWEFSTGAIDSFDDASAPGQVGRRAAAVVGVELADDDAGLTVDVVHWLTGTGYGVALGLLSDGRRPITSGIATGLAAFLASYATLGAIGIYDPIWDYDRDTLAQDASAHVVFGLAAGLALAALSPGRD